jgi:hypothetical protein
MSSPRVGVVPKYLRTSRTPTREIDRDEKMLQTKRQQRIAVTLARVKCLETQEDEE